MNTLYLTTAFLIPSDETRVCVPTRTITRVVWAATNFDAIALMEDHISAHELLRSDEWVDYVDAQEAIGLP